MKNTLQAYKSIIEPVWCPGCGDYGVLNALQKALMNLEIEPEDIIAVSGIGCSGRFSHFVNSYALHGTHGRAIPTALGAKTGRPQSTVLAVGGDGDGLGIGGGHIAHAARKNIDMTYLLIDNSIYGLTKGQSSPTSPMGIKTKTSPYGVYEDSLEALPIFLAYNVSFVARANGLDVKNLTDILTKAISHKGFSIVYVLSPCKTFPILDAKGLKEILVPLPEDFDPKDKIKAYEYAYSKTPMYTGIFQWDEKPTLEDRLQTEIKKATLKEKEGELYSVEEIIHSFV